MKQVDDAGVIMANGDLVGATVVVRAYADSDGGLLAVEYPAEPLTVDLTAAILGNMIKDCLGPEPDMRDVIALQKSLVATMQGGDTEGKRTK